MAEIDVAKQWKAYIVSALGMTLIHTEHYRGSEGVEIHLGGKRSFPLGRFLPIFSFVHQGSKDENNTRLYR
jgi:hypothetical protein